MSKNELRKAGGMEIANNWLGGVGDYEKRNLRDGPFP